MVGVPEILKLSFCGVINALVFYLKQSNFCRRDFFFTGTVEYKSLLYETKESKGSFDCNMCSDSCTERH